MSNGMKFDAEFQRSRGNFLNSHEGEIEGLVRKSDGRSQERHDYQKSLRARFLPEIPGYVPKNPIFKAEANRALDYLVELRVKAALINKDTPFTAHFADLREMWKAATNPVESLTHPLRTTLNILRAYSDGLGEGERAKARMMREFYNQAYSFTQLSNRIYQEEKKDSASWKITESYRADVSRNRLESFFLGVGMPGLHHEISQAISAMEKTWRGEEQRLRGAHLRRSTGILGDTFGLVLPALLYKESLWDGGSKKLEVLKNKLPEAIYGKQDSG